MIRITRERRGRIGRLWESCSWYGGRLIFGATNGLSAWWQYRNFRYFLRGLPALLAGIFTVLVAAHIALTPRAQVIASYQHEARRALQAGDYPAAQKCYERLAVLQGDKPEIRYGLALTAEATGQHERAQALFDALAPLDRQGYGPAHLRQAKRLLTGANASPKDLQAAELHLRRTLQGQPDEVEAHAKLGQLYLATGRLDQAEGHLLETEKVMPGLRLQLAQLYRAQNKQELAQRQAKQAIEFFRPQAESDLDNHLARLNWAAAVVLLEDFAGAVAILRPGLAMDAPLYRQALAGVYLDWSDALARDSKAVPGDRLALVEQGLEYTPDHLVLLRRLIALSKDSGAEAEKARAVLQKMLAHGKAAATAHMLLGMDAWERKAGEARQHYEAAHRLAPQNDVVANNLAWALAQSEPTDLPRALALINLVLERQPEAPTFRDTQEKILAKMRAPTAQPGRAIGGSEILAPEIFHQPGGGHPIEELGKAVASFQRSEYEQALDLLKAACKQQAALPPAGLMLARLFLADNQLAKGRTALEQAAADSPQYPGVYLALGSLALVEGRPAEAVLNLEKAETLAESGLWTDGQKHFFLTQSHAGRAAVAEDRKDWPAVQAALSAWLKLDPKNGKARQRLARIFVEIGKPSEAAKELEQAAKDDPTLLPAAVTLGWFYTHKGDRKKAAAAMEEAITKAPNDPKAHLGVAAWLLQQGEAEQARQRVDTAAQLGLDSKELKLLRGLIARHLKNYPQAENYFQAVHQESPEDFQASNQLALVLAEQPEEPKWQHALKLALANVRVYPKSAETFSTLGRIYHRLGRLEEAEKALQAAVSGGKASPEAAYYLACLLADRGRPEAAQQLLKFVLDAPGSFLFRREAQELFAQLAKKP